MLLLITARGSVAVHSRSGCTHWVDIRCFGGFSFHLTLQNPEPDTYLDRHSVRENEVVDLLFRVGRALMAPRPRGPGSSWLCLHRRGCWLHPGQDRPGPFCGRGAGLGVAPGFSSAGRARSLLLSLPSHHQASSPPLDRSARDDPDRTNRHGPPPPTLPCP